MQGLGWRLHACSPAVCPSLNPKLIRLPALPAGAGFVFSDRQLTTGPCSALRGLNSDSQMQRLALTISRRIFSIIDNTAPLGFTAFATETAEGFFIGSFSSRTADSPPRMMAAMVEIKRAGCTFRGSSHAAAAYTSETPHR